MPKIDKPYVRNKVLPLDLVGRGPILSADGKSTFDVFIQRISLVEDGSGTIFLALVCLVIGCVVGAFIARLSMQRDSSNKELQQKLAETEKKFSDYQAQVTEHFLETSVRVNRLTHSYREVHEHLAQSASQLANPDISQQLLKAASGTLEDNSAVTLTDSDLSPTPPKDWAPRKDGDVGQLSENFGLTEDEDSSVDERIPPGLADTLPPLQGIKRSTKEQE